MNLETNIIWRQVQSGLNWDLKISFDDWNHQYQLEIIVICHYLTDFFADLLQPSYYETDSQKIEWNLLLETCDVVLNIIVVYAKFLFFPRNFWYLGSSSKPVYDYEWITLWFAAWSHVLAKLKLVAKGFHYFPHLSVALPQAKIFDKWRIEVWKTKEIANALFH